MNGVVVASETVPSACSCDFPPGSCTAERNGNPLPGNRAPLLSIEVTTSSKNTEKQVCFSRGCCFPACNDAPHEARHQHLAAAAGALPEGMQSFHRTLPSFCIGSDAENERL